MNIRYLQRLAAALAALAVAALLGPAAHAQQYQFSISTAGLTVTDSYAVDLLLNGGDSPASSVTAYNFAFGGGSASATSPATVYSSGTTSGDLGSGVTLTVSPSTTASEYAQNFTPGSTLSFVVDGTNLAVPASANAAPDEFQFDLYDNTTSAPVPSSAGTSGALLTLTRDATGAYLPAAYSYMANSQTYAGMVTPYTSAAPEPSGAGVLALIGLSVGGLLLGARRRAAVPRP